MPTQKSSYIEVDRIDNIRGSILIDEFDGGLNTTDSNEILRENEAVIRQNWSNDERGAMTKVDGYTKANTTLLGAKPIRGLFRVYISAGTKHLLAICNGTLNYSTDNGANFAAATGGTGLTETVYNSGVNYNDLFFFTNSTDNLYHYTLGTHTMAAATSKPTDPCKILLKRSDRRLLALVNAVNGSTLYFSKVDPTGVAADDWSATSDAGSIAIDGAKSETLTGGMTFGAVDIIFKDYAAFKVWGYPAPQAIRLSGSPGCAAPYSVAQGDGLGFHLAHDGVYMYDGNKFICISDPIEGFIDDINPLYVQNAFGVYRDGLYWLFYTASDDTVNKSCLIYDSNRSNPYIGKNVWYERINMEMNCPAIFTGTGDDNEIYAGGSADTGFVYRLDYSASGKDDTANIEAVNQTKYYDGGYPNLVKRFTQIKVTYYLNTGQLNFNWYVNRGATTGNYSGVTGNTGTALGSFVLDTSTLAGVLDTTNIARLDDTAVGKDISIKISNDAAGAAPIMRRIEILWEGLYYE
jgi:hypothetical protein